MIARRARLRSLGLAPLLALAATAGSCGGGTGDEPLGMNESAAVVCPKGTTTPGIDVSYYQGTIDWPAVKGAGYQFAIIRTSDGSYEDPKFASNWAGAKSAGLIRGVYHFFRPAKDPVAQADLVIGKVGVLAADDLPVTADVEATDSQSAATIAANLHTFVDRVQAGTGKKPIIYTGSYFWNDNVNAKEFATSPLWIAHYTTGCPNLPTNWSDWAFFQHSSTGSVAGISGNVDLDRFNGTLADLRAFVAASGVCGAETCNGLDDDCNGTADDGDVCEEEALRLDTAAYAPPRTTDVDGDGKADVCARGIAGFWCHRSLGTSWSAKTPSAPLTDANGWDDPKYWSTIRMGDVDGDGKADVCARSKDGVSCWLGSAGGFGAEIKGPALSDASGWGAIEYHSTLRLADVDGDGKDDLCALAAKGLVCWRSEINGGVGGFGAEIAGPAWSTSGGYSVAKHYGTLRMGDVDGDGRADACLRGPGGVECWLSDGKGFPSSVSGPSLTDASGWGALKYWHSIRLADFDGDGRADLCARSSSSLRCWRSTGHAFDGGVEVAALSDASGWSDPSNYRTLRVGDVDGDGKDDLCVRSNTKVLCYHWTGDAFASIDGPAWTDANGWDASKFFDTIRMGDFDGDGRSDVCARAAAGFRCAPSTGAGFGAEIGVAEFTDVGGWGGEPYYPTLQYGGPARAGKPVGDAGPGDSGAIDSGPVADGGVDAADGGDVVVSAAAEAGCSCRVGGEQGSRGKGASAAALVALGAAFALLRTKRRA